MSPSMSLSSLAFALTTIYASFITHNAFQKPNPDVSDPTDVDKWNSRTSDLIGLLLKYIVPALGIYHAIVSLYLPFASTPPPLLCPHPQNLSPTLFTWSSTSILTLALLLTFGHLRLWTYRALGKDFVYQLNRPSRLVTSGPYRYAQHPSYPAALVVWFVFHASFTRLDAVAGCWLPAGVTQWAGAVALVHCALWAVFLAWVIPPRVKDEEVMLKREYGREWEDWA